MTARTFHARVALRQTFGAVHKQKMRGVDAVFTGFLLRGAEFCPRRPRTAVRVRPRERGWGADSDKHKLREPGANHRRD